MSWSHYRTLLQVADPTTDYQNYRLEFIKNPVVAEFFGFSGNTGFTESYLEKSRIIISTLFFCNYILKCFVLIDLKMEKITHQDEGQMDMHIRMYDGNTVRVKLKYRNPLMKCTNFILLFRMSEL